jgi:hypothetical protein
MTRTLTFLAAFAALAIPAAPAVAASPGKPTAPRLTYILNNTMISGYSAKAGSSNGFVMRDGGICDPIHTIGC